MNTNSNIQALSVTDVNLYIKSLLRSDDILSSVAIRGEISNFKRHSTGTLYFTLKDSGAEISAVMFRGDVQNLRFNPSDGMRVVVYGRIDVYEKSGRYQIYVSRMINDGIGAMAEAYERLKRKLAAEGLFAEERKRPLPKYPERIGVITAPTGAAIRDILNITGRRYPRADILLYPSLVQGADAPMSLLAGLQLLNAYGACDVIILGRGGGSIEDLWAFNDEALVRAVAASEIPVISAVGHETDFTLCDFAADRRAPTPSAAAEIAVPDINALIEGLQNIENRMTARMSGEINLRRQALLQKEKLLSVRSPEAKLRSFGEQIERKREKLDSLIDKKYEKKTSEYNTLIERLNALNPLSVLQRGYSALTDKDGRIVSTVTRIAVKDRVSLIMSDGRAEAEILSVQMNEKLQGE